jgi:hypothetical protein
MGTREGGLAVAVTMRADGRPRASVVNAGVLDHPVTGEAAVGFVSRGSVRKLDDLRARPAITVVFRSGWDWVAVEGDATLLGPDDNPTGLEPAAILEIVRACYAAAVGGTPEQWTGLDQSFVAERHTAVLIHPRRVYGA